MKPTTVTATRFGNVDSDQAICNVARISFLKDASTFPEEKNRGLLKYLISHGHWTPLGHSRLCFDIDLPVTNLLHFLENANMAGFVWRKNGRLTRLNGSLWAWATNMYCLPSWVCDTVVNECFKDFPWASEFLFKPELALQGQSSAYRVHIHEPKFEFASIRCIAPCFVARRLVKHQVGFCWNEESRRYVDDPPTFFEMGEWHGRPDGSIKQGAGDLHEDQAKIQHMVDETHGVSDFTYKSLIRMGVAPEEARSVLPQSQQFEWIWTANLLSWARMCQQRLDPHAQKATRLFAQQVNAILEEDFPYLWPQAKDELARTQVHCKFPV